ncbi:MAG: hypothetical protein M1823_002059 [Watsoniomyces obsoletus]|nr:MAG: hypothetical protein M1823_002059 [Watsoniomyces obsoletus]
MDSHDVARLERTSSNHSYASTKSRRSERARVRSQAPTPPTAPIDKGLTSFPSLSPDTSPKDRDPRVDVPNKAQPSDTSTPTSSKTTASTVSVLTGSTPSMRRRTALFNDSPLGEHLVPGTLHHTTDEHIERLAAKNGAVALIRQLAEDLAQRDAQMSAFQRRAEEREKVLRKMLRECEVSNMDIEARLHRATLGTAPPGENKQSSKSSENLEKTKNSAVENSSGEGTIDEMVDQAMRDALVGDGDNEASSLDVDSIASRSIRQVSLGTGSAATTIDDDARSGEQPMSATMRKTSKGTSRGWIDYIWAGSGTSRKSSGGSSVNAETAEDPMATAKPKRTNTAATRRGGLTSDLFQAPNGHATASRPVSRTRDVSAESRTGSRQTSTSVASWAVKLVAGNGKPSADGGRRTSAESLAASSPRRASAGAGKPMESAKAALSKLSGTHRGGFSAHRSAVSLNVAANGTVRSGGSKYTHAPSNPTSPAMARSPSSASGPVEMDAILPPDTQPPTLHQTYNHYHPTDFVTDRFGFIYDQRRKWRKNDVVDENHHTQEDANRRAEMLSPVMDRFPSIALVPEVVPDEVDGTASPASDLRPESQGSNQEAEEQQQQLQSKPSKRWQDYLKIATFPTELLSDTPGGGRMPTVQTSETHATKAHITVANGGTLVPARLNPQPAASTIVAENATFAKSGSVDALLSTTPKKPPQEPVRMLVEQLTDLHDSLQHERTIKWNEFLRKVRAERRREGEAAVVTEGRPDSRFMPEATLADGEVIGVAGLGNKGKIGRAKWNEFKQLVLSGIPVTYRAKIWAECSGALTLRTPGYYDDLVQQGVDDPIIVAQIGMDVHRTLTDNVFFRDGPGVAKLNEVLHAYARRNPDIGYCQGMNLIVASLLLIVPTAEDAFWLLTSMIENILPPHYYDHSLLASRADQQVLRQYVAELLPRLSAHLDDLSIELEALTFQWFLSVFTGCLSAEALFRVWDVVLCTNDGSTFLFQVALALLSLNEQALLNCKTPAGVYSYINHQMTNHAISIDGLIRASDALKKVVTRGEVEERREKVMERELAGRRPLALTSTATSIKSMD